MSEHVAFLDSDDLWLPRKLEMQIASLGEHPPRAWSTKSVMVNGSGQPLQCGHQLHYPETKDGWIAESLLRGEARVTQSSVLARRAGILVGLTREWLKSRVRGLGLAGGGS